MVKILAYIAILFLVQNGMAQNTSNSSIDNYIGLSAELIEDTVCADNTIILKVVFKNKTDSCIKFYHKALLSIVKHTGGFEFDSYYLNKVFNLKEEVELGPLATYKETYKIHVKPPVFNKGINYLHLYYLCKEQSGNFKKYNKLHGSLESDEFRIFVK